MPITRALIIDEPWISKILSGEKTWEMRTKKTNIRGRIGLIRKGSGLIVGEVDLVDSLEKMHFSMLLLPQYVAKHHVTRVGDVVRWPCPWVLENVQEYVEPVPYTHKQGAVIWVKLYEVKQ